MLKIFDAVGREVRGLKTAVVFSCRPEEASRKCSGVLKGVGQDLLRCAQEVASLSPSKIVIY